MPSTCEKIDKYIYIVKRTHREDKGKMIIHDDKTKRDRKLTFRSVTCRMVAACLPTSSSETSDYRAIVYRPLRRSKDLTCPSWKDGDSRPGLAANNNYYLKKTTRFFINRIFIVSNAL